MIKTSLAMATKHYNCRGGVYPRSAIQRFIVPDDKIMWSTEFKEYDPPSHTSPDLFGKPWADPEIGDSSFAPKWNSPDGKVSRVSYMGQYQIVNGYPLNPIGRTGIAGRGVLGRWGPNHAADPVVTRWKRHDNGDIVFDRVLAKPILQFIAIKRRDTGEWALPGGMVDPGEKIAATVIREFQEEALNSFDMTDDDKSNWKQTYDEFFGDDNIVYQGYVDDIRNTDNSWMETVAYSFHDESGSVTGSLKLNAGDDAVGVQWLDIRPSLKLYASHSFIVHKVLIDLLWRFR